MTADSARVITPDSSTAATAMPIVRCEGLVQIYAMAGQQVTAQPVGAIDLHIDGFLHIWSGYNLVPILPSPIAGFSQQVGDIAETCVKFL